ncbi:MAG: helicase-exonuclease AddAB subunit AddA [Defluviitaleaceae bacterium]|nr:helicase-exonuclease AddAB subunit AddA [Defluviitaleaceae bacterium]MCL2274956.1 helicase-exonuclease AddAB subunit AddA [Defluviitaleaceae bacterium]
MSAQISFTPAQQAAIDCDAPQILVSAAAGSGKTAVLTARIMRHIESGYGLERLLVVTFTEAAAAGMKDKVTERLQEGHFPRQLALLPGADISTIHAFCRKLVKAHFQQVGLDPAFRVGDDAELGLIKVQVMDELFEAMYQAEDAGFIDLADVFGGKTGDTRLDTLVRKLYEFLESDPFPQAAAQRYAGVYDGVQDIGSSPWANVAREELAQGLTGALESLKRAREVCMLPNGPEKYIERIEQDEEMLRRFCAGINGEFEELYHAVNTVTWGRLPAIGKKDEVDPALKERAQRLRSKGVKKAVDDLFKGIFFAPPDKMRDDIAALAPRVNALMGLAARFAQAYAEEKRARNLLDFSDLEHFAIRVLYPNGPADMTPSPAALALRRKYREVLIDEYQDANEIQELILSAVCERRFMVGDVKQSIYRFRRANPQLFLRKYEGLENVERIDLSQNFRSRGEVLDGINFFFSQIMCKDVGEVAYDDAASLKPGADYPPWVNGDGRVILDILDEEDEAQNEEQQQGDESEEAASPLQNEARLIAKRVHEMLETQEIWDASLGAYRKCRLSDMVILARSVNTLAPTVIETLKACGIPAIADMGAAFFDQWEVKVALSFLRVIDNPRQDIDLIAVLFSPVYGVNADELLILREGNKNADFYDCVQMPQAVELEEKLARFRSDLTRFRGAAAHLPISRLIGLVYDTTQLPAHVGAMSGGAVRAANLQLLMERAMAFEETRLTGLFHFTRYIQRLHATDASDRINAATETAGENVLRLMSIHKSKGLEFPIVFASFLGRKFNVEDERQPLILHSESGIGAQYTDTHLRTISNTLPRFSLQRLTRRENLSEEMRCLYVAMTRAMQKLILTARCKSYEREQEKWQDAAQTPAGTLPTYYRRAAARYLDWLMPCILRSPEASAVCLHIHKRDGIAAYQEIALTMQTQAPAMQTQALPLLEAAPALPSKLSISEIKRLYASDLTPDSATVPDTMPPVFDPPAFIRAEQGLTAMRMGSILHAITEHMDYHLHKTPEAVEALIIDLQEKNLLTPEEAHRIDRAKILTLATSPLGERIRNAPKLYREMPFVMAENASEIFPNHAHTNEKILIHGIIDAYFEEDGKIVLIDFKSDHALHTTETDLINRHRTQLDIYKKAVAQATAKDVKEVLLYSFALGAAIIAS